MMTKRTTLNDSRIAKRFQEALTDFLVAAKDGQATTQQRSALVGARAAAESLSDEIYAEVVKRSFLEAGYDY
jgi:hypothetical protein